MQTRLTIPVWIVIELNEEYPLDEAKVSAFHSESAAQDYADKAWSEVADTRGAQVTIERVEVK